MYYFHVQREFGDFWSQKSCIGRSILFIFGLGFDPRCSVSLNKASKTLNRAERLDTLCLRFQNAADENLEENVKGTEESIEEVEWIYNAMSPSSRHAEVEVNLFDAAGIYQGHGQIISEVLSAYPSLSDYSDIIVDITTFPRSLIYSLLLWLQDVRVTKQNLYAVLSEVTIPVDIGEQGFGEPHYMIQPSERSTSSQKHEVLVWIPVLGGNTERLNRIYAYLQPKEVFPIVPFPTSDPRTGDRIVLNSRKLFDEWLVPFTNVMYACGDVPFDIYRKIHDIVLRYRSFMHSDNMVVTALSGRSLSLGVLLAAWVHKLPVCLIQPKTYRLNSPSRETLGQAAQNARVTLFWLAGEIYD